MLCLRIQLEGWDLSQMLINGSTSVNDTNTKFASFNLTFCTVLTLRVLERILFLLLGG